MGIAAHLYSDAELTEIERVFRVGPRSAALRTSTGAWARCTTRCRTTPRRGSARWRSRRGWRFLERLSDCFDPANWLKPDTDCDRLLEQAAASGFDEAQLAVSDELFWRFARRLAERAGGR